MTVEDKSGQSTSRAPAPRGGEKWLPAPVEPFNLMMRLYAPKTGKWNPPPVMKKV